MIASSIEGELVSLRFSVESRLLEDLLEALACIDFPVNPQLFHRPAQVEGEFPAFARRIGEVRQALAAHGFDAERLEIHGILEDA